MLPHYGDADAPGRKKVQMGSQRLKTREIFGLKNKLISTIPFRK